MIRPPAFWRAGGGGFWPALLAPLGAVYGAATARRLRRPGWRAPVPVLCCGNATAGGSGKTILALELARLLAARGVAVHALLRGYGGRSRGPLRVDPARHDAALVGDEALLLAAALPTWVAADREAGARAAVASGAAAIILDDGLQNPALVQDLALLTIDGTTGFGNGQMIPAGPLREPVATAAARCHAAVMIGADRVGAASRLPPGLPVLHAALRLGPEAASLAGQRVFAFCGIGVPEKFLASLAEANAILVGERRFADHHRFSAHDLRAVRDAASRLGAVPVTTAKDFVRLPPAWRDGVQVLTVRLEWAEPAAIEALLSRLGLSAPAKSTEP